MLGAALIALVPILVVILGISALFSAGETSLTAASRGPLEAQYSRLRMGQSAP